MTKYKYMGKNEDDTYCELCGKTNLKSVVWLLEENDSEPKAYGTTCAAKLMRITTKEAKSWIVTEEKKYIDLAKKEYQSSIEYKNYQEIFEKVNNDDSLTFVQRCKSVESYRLAKEAKLTEIKSNYKIKGII
ncbi:MAG: hypothetical protein GY793_05615 [Proteobacteria bacterium]|nr:hypothetical protein [Pseudomonadota bacterium]